MHLLFVTRGIQNQVDMLTKSLETWGLPFPRKNIKTNIIEQGAVQCGLKPIQFWDFNFPKDQLDLVLRRVRPNKEFTGDQASFNKYVFILRKVFGAKEIPSWDVNAPQNFINLAPDVQRFGIGIVEDNVNVIGDYEQEML